MNIFGTMKEQADEEEISKQKRAIETVKSLEPGDKIQTDAYSTPLIAHSEAYETTVRTPSIHGDANYHDVYAVTVSNPRGGFYQIGVRKDVIKETSFHHEDARLYIGPSHNHPPAPNKVISREDTFSELELVERDAKDVDAVDPDREKLESPLPDNTASFDDLDGVGEKTRRKLFLETDYNNAHELALAFYTEDEDTSKAEEVLASLPRSDQVRVQLIELYEGDIEPNRDVDVGIDKIVFEGEESEQDGAEENQMQLNGSFS